MSAGITSVKRWEITGRASKRHRLDVGVPAYSKWVRFSRDLVFDERVCAENLMQVSRLLGGQRTLCIVRF